MPLFRPIHVVLCFVFLGVNWASAADQPDPLEFIPNKANLIFKLNQPRTLIEGLTQIPGYAKYQNLPFVRDYLDSTSARRFFQFITFAEKKLGAEWPNLLDDLAGKGLAIGTVAGKDPAPFLVAMQGNDPERARVVFDLLLELGREEIRRVANLADVDPLQSKVIGPDTVYSLTGPEGDAYVTCTQKGTILLSNNSEAMKLGLELAQGKNKADSILSVKHFAAAKEMTKTTTLAWLWFDLLELKKSQASKDFFAATRNDILQTVVVGSSIDAVRRADFVLVDLSHHDQEYQLSVQLPAKRADLPNEFALHVPMKNPERGSMPLLQPPGTLYSQSFYLDLKTIWTDRKKLFNEQQIQDFENFAKQISVVIPGATLGKLLEMSGPYHRLVAVERGHNYYETQSDFPLPEMAIVLSMRDKEFGNSMNAALRGAGLLASLNFKLKSNQEEIDGVKLVSYHFPDAVVLEEDPTNIRYSTVPSFAVVGDFVVISTSPKLIKDLLPELRRPISPSEYSPSVWRSQLYGEGAASGFLARPEVAITDAILSQGVDLPTAKKQLQGIANFLRSLGTLSFDIQHTETAYRLDITWKYEK